MLGDDKVGRSGRPDRLLGGDDMTDTIERSGTDDDDASEVLDHLVVRFAGDSGDGMQLTGSQFTSVSATFVF